MQTVNREDLLHQLESVQPGLSAREIIEQSSCFVFQDGKVQTYNDEIACTNVCVVKVTGAVQAVPLLGILRKLVEDELEVEVADGELVLYGKKRQAHIRCEAEIMLPIDKVEQPTKWKPLHGEFLEGIGLVQHSASRDESQFHLTCIHLHPKYLEACDNYQATRVRLETGVAASTLVRRDSIKHIVALGVNQFSESETWIHFKNKEGLVLSCRRYLETFPDLKGILSFTGHPITLPRGLGNAADKAAVFSAESPEDNQVLVELGGDPKKEGEGRLRIVGQGASGWYQEVKKLKYDGPNLSFMVAPELLIELVKQHTEAEITEGKLRVDGGSWRWVTCLGMAEAKGAAPPAAEPAKEE